MANIRFDNGDEVTTLVGDERIPCISDPEGTREDKWVEPRTLAAARDVVTTVTSSGGTTTLDLSLGNYFKTTLTENTTIAVINPPAAGSHSLRITQHASAAKTVTFPASFLKQGGGDFVISTALGARDRIIFTHDDGGTTYDADLGKAYA